MKVVLTESQYKKLLLENYKNIVGEKLMSLHNFSSQVVRDASKQLGFDFTFLLSYGAGIGALLKAVNEYLKGNFSGLDENQIAGLTIMAISVVFLETKNYRKSLDKIDDDGLNKELISAVGYTEKLKDKFAHLLKVLGLSIHRTSNIISYSFLIPLLNTLIGVVTKYGLDSEQFAMFIESFLISGIIAVEGVAIRNILLKAGEIIQNRNIKQS
jgi:hypothetical protein